MIVEAFHDVVSLMAPNVPGLTYDIGAEFLRVTLAPPRLVWVPVREGFAPGQVKTGLTAAARPAPGSKSALTRLSYHQVALWGRGADAQAGQVQAELDIQAVEDLLSQFLWALRLSQVGNFTVEQAVWVPADGTQVAEYGRRIDVTIVMQIPVTIPNRGTTTLQVPNVNVDGDMTPPPTS